MLGDPSTAQHSTASRQIFPLLNTSSYEICPARRLTAAPAASPVSDDAPTRADFRLRLVGKRGDARRAFHRSRTQSTARTGRRRVQAAILFVHKQLVADAGVRVWCQVNHHLDDLPLIPLSYDFKFSPCKPDAGHVSDSTCMQQNEAHRHSPESAKSGPSHVRSTLQLIVDSIYPTKKLLVVNARLLESVMISEVR